MSYLLDTDWIINALRGSPTENLEIERLRDAGIAVSIISYGELCEGIAAATAPEVESAIIDGFLSPFPLIPLDKVILRRFGAIRRDLRRQGQLLPDMDLLIAATAVHFGLVLMTHNRRHFARTPSLHLYQPR